MSKRILLLFVLVLTIFIFAACTNAEEPAAEAVSQEAEVEAEAPIVEEAEEAAEKMAEADLDAVKAYAVDNADKMKAATAAFKESAETYHAWMADAQNNFPDENPYQHLFDNHPAEVAELLNGAKAQWVEASTYYELDEGIVAGVPTLAFYDIWIDAGASAADDPEEALAWQLVLADGTTLESPGNFFHSLAEPTLYGTVEDYTALAVDLDGNGEVELGEAMPDADILLATAQGLDQATADMQAALGDWEPTLKDTFGALVTMIPTMNEYFEQWKLSAYISGEEAEEASFIAVSRLFDINGILTGLDVAYQNVSPVVEEADADLNAQIESGFSGLLAYVGDLYEQEQAGTVFAADEVDLFGTEAQDRATALAGQVAQAAALAEIALNEADPVIPDEAIVITAEAPEPSMSGLMTDDAMDDSMEGAMGDAPDLAAVKTFAVDNAAQMKAGTASFLATATDYYRIINDAGFDYEAAWANNGPELAELVAQAKADWIEASTYYELDEGIVAGVPTLAFYDIWIDAGASAADDPEEALEWQLTLPDGTTLESPGNFFHSLAEPALYGTVDAYVGLEVDLDGDGQIELGEVLPEANILLGTAQGLDQATAEMVDAVNTWEPTLGDTFGALVTMIPTMNEYFEQWKLSSYISGEDYEEASFVAVSRLFDINGILTGLNFAYGNVSPAVSEVDTGLDDQISSGFADLVGYVSDMYEQEQTGTVFSPEEADLFGTEAQDRATALAGQVAQAAALAEIELNEDDPTIPESPIVIVTEFVE